MEFFTQDDLNNTMSLVMMSPNFKIMEHKFDKLFNFGNTKMGNHCRLTVRVKADDNVGLTQSFFTKFIPNIEEYKKFVIDNDCFRKEAYFYSHIAPVMEALLPSELHLPTPMCYFSRVGGSGMATPESSQGFEASTLVLQDLNPLGYITMNTWLPLDFLHCKVVMRALAVFHGGSVLLQKSTDESPENMEVIEAIRSLKESFFTSDQDSMSKKILNASTETTATVICQIWPVRFRKEKFYDKLLDALRHSLRNVQNMLNPVSNLISVLCHGELCGNNILFAYDKEQGIQTPIDAKFVDMQLLRYSPPVTDILMFLHICTRRKFRDVHLQELLSYYQIEIARAVSPRVADKILSLEALQAGMEDMQEFGLLAAIHLMPVCLLQSPARTSAPSLRGSDPSLAEFSQTRGMSSIYRKFSLNEPVQGQHEDMYSLLENQAQRILHTMEINQMFKVRLKEAYQEYLEFVGLWEDYSSEVKEVNE